MRGNELSKTIKEMGRRIGMCDAYYIPWSDGYSKDDLMDLFISGQDFCIEHDFPPLDFIRRHFSKDERLARKIFCGEHERMVTEESGTYILLGGTALDLEIRGFSVADIYVRHDSKLRLSVYDNAIVSVNIYDSGLVEYSGYGIHEVKVYDHR